jgi:starch synthase
MVDLGLPWELYTPERFEWYGQLNLLKAGLTFSDFAVTVSPTHAKELCTPEGGFGLHGTFNHMGDRLVGICNGIDEDVWNPATDRDIAARYSRDDLAGKAVCKKALQLTLGLAQRPDVLLFGMSARLAKQKGFDIILKSESLRSLDAQFVFLGTGAVEYQSALSAIARERPDKVAVEFAFTELLEHRLIAGADALLMPSLYEPCGLTQMRAQRYGAPVIGRRTGGITDTVEDGETGFLFDDFTEQAFDEAMSRAVERFGNRQAWRAMMRRGMACDFGWERAARQYRDVYDSAIKMATKDA